MKNLFLIMDSDDDSSPLVARCVGDASKSLRARIYEGGNDGAYILEVQVVKKLKLPIAPVKLEEVELDEDD